jgi:steroid delta-isomerase-like uncharacterized protein
MNASDTVALIERYYAAFNAGDSEAMLACVSEDIAHDVNQGGRRSGKTSFRDFSKHMERCYAEQLENIVIMASPDGSRAAAEFDVLGTYIETDSGLPPASGQTYRLPAGTFFDITGGLISRVTTYYNLADWLRQIAGPSAEQGT